MHTHAVAKNPISYEHIDPEAVGNERRILVSELSGQSTILAKTTKYDINNDKALVAKDPQPVMQDLPKRRLRCSRPPRHRSGGTILVKKAIGQYKPWFGRINYRVSSEQDQLGQPNVEATVKLSVGDQIQHTVSDGVVVNAIDSALHCDRCCRSTPRRLTKVPRRLQGAGVVAECPRRAARVPRRRGDRSARRHACLGHGGRQRKHHRSLVAGTGGFDRV